MKEASPLEPVESSGGRLPAVKQYSPDLLWEMV